MYPFLMIVHVVVCLVLITVVLLQAGRGGGFSEMVGGSQPQSIFGTQTNAFMTRLTEVCAVLFIVTSLSLGLVTSYQGKSLMQKNPIPVQSSPKSDKLGTEPAVDVVKTEVAKVEETAAKV